MIYNCTVNYTLTLRGASLLPTVWGSLKHHSTGTPGRKRGCYKYPQLIENMANPCDHYMVRRSLLSLLFYRFNGKAEIVKTGSAD